MKLEHTLWHPVALSHVVGSAPQAVTLLGEELVLWRDGSGAAQAWADGRISRVAGGSSEIMKEIIGRSMVVDG